MSSAVGAKLQKMTGAPLGTLRVKGGKTVRSDPKCPGCHLALESVSVADRADDLYLCPHCFHSWFAFELDLSPQAPATDDGPLPSE